MKAVAAYQNYRENISVEVYPTLAGKTLIEDSIIGLDNGEIVDLAEKELPEEIEEFFDKKKGSGTAPASVKWILIEEDENTRIYISQDCTVNIHTSDPRRSFLMNDAMYKACLL